MQKYGNCQLKTIVQDFFLTNNGTKLIPRLLIHEWQDDHSFHGFHMIKRGVESMVGNTIKDVYIYEIYPPDWLKLSYGQSSQPLMALTPEDALDGMFIFIDEYSKKNLKEAEEIRQKSLETLDEA